MRARARIFLGTGASTGCTTIDGGCAPMGLDGYGVCASIWGLYLCDGRTLMTELVGPGDGRGAVRRVWEAVVFLLEYSVKTSVAVGLFIILAYASRLIRWVGEDARTAAAPEVVSMLKVLELVILVSDALLCGLFIVHITIEFIGSLFPKTAAWVTSTFGGFFSIRRQQQKEKPDEIL